MERYNNWMTFSFDGVPMAHKQTRGSLLELHFNIPSTIKKLSYFDALYYNAQVMRDSYNEPFDVLLSGGIDSEVIVRTFKDLKIKHNTFIFRYENNLNIRDVTSAIDICTSLNIPYTIIDFNLQNFYESGEASLILDKTLTHNLASLSKIKWLDYLDNIPVSGVAEPHWRRNLVGDYSKKSDWTFHLYEWELFYSLNQKMLGRTIIGEWFHYTPQLLMSFHTAPVINDVINDRVPGKQGTHTSRIPMYQHIWPDIKNKPKLSGYEGNGTPSIDTAPQFFKDFGMKHGTTNITNASFLYSLEDIDTIFKQGTI